jgi:hypothetical protein
MIDLCGTDPTRSAFTLTPSSGPLASSVVYIYTIPIPPFSDSAIIAATTLNANPDVYRLLMAMNYALLTGAQGWENIVGWECGEGGRGK